MQQQEVIEGWRGVAVSCGLGTPMSRAITAGVVSGILFYTAGYPRNAFAVYLLCYVMKRGCTTQKADRSESEAVMPVTKGEKIGTRIEWPWPVRARLSLRSFGLRT